MGNPRTGIPDDYELPDYCWSNSTNVCMWGKVLMLATFVCVFIFSFLLKVFSFSFCELTSVDM